MEELFKIPALDPELENIKELKRLKKKVWSKFSLTSDKTQIALTDVVTYLFIFEKNDELIEVCEALLKLAHVPSFSFPYLYGFYLQAQKSANRDNDKLSEIALQRLNLGSPGWSDTFEISEKEMALIRSDDGLRDSDLLGILVEIMSTAVLELAFGERSSFDRVFLENKLTESLKEIRTILKIEI